jgi:acylphosphatase
MNTSIRLDVKDTHRLHIWVTGRVQGVGFRAFAQQAGSTLQLTGWVRNVGYDQVEAMAEGPRVTLEQYAEALKAGPRGSRVDECRLEWEKASGEYDRFYVRSSR